MKTILVTVLFLTLNPLISYSYAERENIFELGSAENDLQRSLLDRFPAFFENVSIDKTENLKEDILSLTEENDGVFDPVLITNTLQDRYFDLTEKDVLNIYQKSFQNPFLPTSLNSMRSRWLHGGEGGN